ncbi:MAG: polysaccharide biosynthesis/export family protein [Planctomycetota bacterium]
MNSSASTFRARCGNPFRPLWALALAAGAAAGCNSAPPFDARAVAAEWAAYMQRDYVLRPGDRLTVRVEGATAVQGDPRDNVQEVVVSPTGTIDLRKLPAPLAVAGKSMSAMRSLIVEAYKPEYTEPRISVSLVEAATQSIYVAGEVRTPGAIAFHPGMTMTQAVAAAGSFLHTVKHSDIRILRIAPDGTERTFRVNMEAVFEEEQPDFLLLPGDVVYCQTSGIADAGNWVDLWIRRLLPFQLGGPALGTIR